MNTHSVHRSRLLPAAAVAGGLLAATAMTGVRHDVQAVGVGHVRPAVEYGYAVASTHLSWIAAYCAIAAAVAVAALLVARRGQSGRQPGVHRVPLAMTAGILWPLFVLALAQLGALAALRLLAARTAPPTHGPGGSREFPADVALLRSIGA